MRRRRIYLFFVLAAAASCVLFFSRRSLPMRVCFGSRCLAVELAVTPEEQARGLMHRTRLPRDRGMLFIFPRDDFWSFWMKNTRVPLDIIWLDKDQKVVEILKNVQPAGKNEAPVYGAGRPSRYVLEANAGFAEKNSIKVGDEARFRRIF